MLGRCGPHGPLSPSTLEFLRVYAHGFGGHTQSFPVENRIVYAPYETTDFRHHPGTLGGAGSAGPLDLATENVLQQRYRARKHLRELLRRILEQPVGRIFRQTQHAQVQLQPGRRRHRIRIVGALELPYGRVGSFQGLLPRSVRIEEHVDLVRVTAEDPQVARSGRRSQGGYRVLDAGLAEHQHVGVALDDDGRALFAHRLGDLRKAVEQVPLVEDLRLRRIE